MTSSPKPLSARRGRAASASQVGAALKKDAVVHPYVDESLIGGMVLRVGDRLVDGSVKGQLAAMKKQMLAQPPAVSG